MTTTIAIALYPELTLLDVIGPYEVLRRVPDVEVLLCAAERGLLADDQGLLRVEVEHTFAEVRDPDVLLVGGGFGNRPLLGPDSEIVEWIRAVDAATTWTTSVCTGSLLLGAAGILQGRRASTHWLQANLLESFGASYSDERVVADGKYLTGAGVSAGIDLALRLAAEIAGEQIARAVQLAIEYDPRPPFDSGNPAEAGPDLVALVAAASDRAEQRRRSS